MGSTVRYDPLSPELALIGAVALAPIFRIAISVEAPGNSVAPYGPDRAFRQSFRCKTACMGSGHTEANIQRAAATIFLHVAKELTP